MRKMISVWILSLFLLSIIAGSFLSIAGAEDENTSRGSPRWSSSTSYYNNTFTMGKDWEAANVSVVVFVQTNDQVNKSDASNSYTFSSGEVLQSVVNDLDGKSVSTGTSRHVLAELFTSEYCTFCPGGVGAMDRIARDTNYYPSKMSLIEWHPNSGGYKDSYGFPESDARISWYFNGHSFGYPAAMFDGVIERVGGSQDGNTTSVDTNYKNHINSRTPKASIIDITTRGYKDSNSGWINVSVELLNPTPIRNLKVNYVVVEDVYPAMKGSAYLRYTARSVIPQEDFIPKNHPPKIKNTLGPVTITEDGSDSTTIQLSTAYEDEDLDELTFSSDRDGLLEQNIKVEMDAKYNVTFTPVANWNGVEEITFYADDGRADPVEQKVTVTVSNVNDPPTVKAPMTDFTMFEDIAVEDKFDLTQIFDDIDMDPALNADPQAQLTFTYSGDENIDVIIDEEYKVSFDPDADWNGNETITFKATDSASAYITDDVKIWVRSGNDAPVLATQLPDVTMNEDEKLNDHLDLNDYYTDTDGDSLTYTVIEPENFEIKLKNSLVSIIPDKNYHGTETITFEAIDIPFSDPVVATMEVTVNSVNDAPILNTTGEWNLVSGIKEQTISSLVITQDEPVDITVTAYDPSDNDKLTFADDTALFDIDANTGLISFTPTNDDVGTYAVKISVDDGQEDNNEVFSTITFIVENINDPPETPVIVTPEDEKSYTVDDTISFKGTCDDPDLDLEDSSERLKFEWTTDQNSEVLSTEEEFSTKLSLGTHKITLTVSDKARKSSEAEITITIDINREKDTDGDGTADYIDDDDDNDGMPDSWEIQFDLDPLDPADAEKDSDRDDFTNLREYLGDDGKPGGDDSSNPKLRTSAPVVKTDESDDGGFALDTLTIGILVAVVAVIVIVLLVLFMVTKKKRAQEEQVPETQMQTPQMGPGAMAPGPAPGLMQMQAQPQSQVPMPGYDPAMMQYQQQMMQQQGQGYLDQGYPYQMYPTYPQDMGGTQAQMQTDVPMQPTMAPQDSQIPVTPENTEMPTTAPQTPGLEPSTVQETPQLPAFEEQPQGSEETYEDPLSSAPVEEPKENVNEEQVPDASCPHCNEPIKAGWMLCPNCKEMI